MIKSTFYNLPEEKRNRIIDAIMKEFSSSVAEKASINRIIKNADISRGSFYQYFDDKVDLIEVLMKTFIEFSINEIQSVFISSKGDIFDTYTKLFEVIVDMGKDSKNRQILKNLFKSLKANDDLISDYLINRFTGFGAVEGFLTKFNRDNLRFKSDEDVKNLSLILTQILKNAIFNVFAVGEKRERVEKSFKRKLEIIKCGALASDNPEKN